MGGIWQLPLGRDIRTALRRYSNPEQADKACPCESPAQALPTPGPDPGCQDVQGIYAGAGWWGSCANFPGYLVSLQGSPRGVSGVGRGSSGKVGKDAAEPGVEAGGDPRLPGWGSEHSSSARGTRVLERAVGRLCFLSLCPFFQQKSVDK